jgi:hypothetical protein
MASDTSTPPNCDFQRTILFPAIRWRRDRSETEAPASSSSGIEVIFFVRVAPGLHAGTSSESKYEEIPQRA